MNQVHLGWEKVKVGDRVKYHSPVKGNHTGIVVEVTPPRRWPDRPAPSRIVVQPITTVAAKMGKVEHELMTVNHSLWEIY